MFTATTTRKQSNKAKPHAGLLLKTTDNFLLDSSFGTTARHERLQLKLLTHSGSLAASAADTRESTGGVPKSNTWGNTNLERV